MFTLAVGSIMTIGYEKVYLMQNGRKTLLKVSLSTIDLEPGGVIRQYVASEFFNT
jgi:ABC-type polysaccharide transport system permease subunit